MCLLLCLRRQGVGQDYRGKHLFLKPSCWWKCLAGHDTQVPHFWSKAQSEDAKLCRNPILKIKRWQRLFCPCYCMETQGLIKKGIPSMSVPSNLCCTQPQLMKGVCCRSCATGLQVHCSDMRKVEPALSREHLGYHWSQAGQGFQFLVC